ncbi:MAG: molybdopterin-dependent oxidoreductase, partial [Proteobacteria bacterium]|nr:molybdopterin-dependent oxidoreductase [Pseudomonadota bacterium]
MKNISPIQDIGRRSPRFDAPDKTRGKELFASDLSPENLLWAGVRRAGIAHGQLRSTLTDRAPKAHALNTGNILKAATIIKGDPSAISTCDILLEERFSTPVQEHAYIETENGVARLDGATVQCLLALAALNTKGRTVKMWWDREESMVAGYKRHAARMHYCLGAKKDGELVALKCEIDYDTGAYAHLG